MLQLRRKTIPLLLVVSGMLLFAAGRQVRADSSVYSRPHLRTVDKVYFRTEKSLSAASYHRWKPWDWDAAHGWKPVDIRRLSVEGQGAFWIKLVLPKGGWEDPELFLEAPVLDFEVYQVDREGRPGIMIYKSRDGIHEPVYRRSNLRVHLIPLTDAAEGKVIYIRVRPNRFQYALPWGAVKIGDRDAYLEAIVRNELSDIIFSFVLIFTGLSLLGFQMVVFKKYPPFIGISILALCTGIHFFSLYGFSQFILDEPTLRYYMESLTFYLFPIGGILFVDTIIDSAYGFRMSKPIFKTLLWGYGIHALLMLALDMTGLVSMWATYKVFGILLVLTLIYLIVAIIRMARHVKIDLKIILWGGILAGITDLHDLVHVLTGHYLWLDRYMSIWGMLVLVISMILFMIATYARYDRNLRELNQALEKRVAMRTEELENANAELEAINDELETAVSSLQQAEIQLIQSEKLALLGQLISGIAHEINTPLGSIKSNTEMEGAFLKELAAEGTENIPAVMANISSLNQISLMALDRIAGLVKNLKNFARLEDKEQKWTNLHKGLESTLLIISHRIKGRIQVVKDYGDIPPVLCYPQQINQVFLNVLINAIQAVGHQGTIAIQTRHADDMVHVNIRDDGPGIRDEDRAKLFTPGYTTKNDGTGLGLAICHEIIQRHQGRIRVESRLGEGTTFIIQLPVQGVKGQP